MPDQVKYVVKELNAILGRNYDLIKFDALTEKQLLQLLLDLLVKFGAGEKLDINEDDSETVSLRLLEMLGSIKYRPPGSVEPTQFRTQLLAGDSRTVHHVLHWLLTNKDQVKNTAYLAKYLKIPDIPTDVARNNTIQDMLDLYQSLIDEFKEAHKRTRMLEKENASEIINDIKEMAVERDIVIKRLENVQVNLVDISDKDELLNVSKALRLQQERSKELENQYDTQQSQLKLASDQLKRYLNIIHGQSAVPKTATDVLKHLQEEIQLNSYLVKEKLPQETSSLEKELGIMQIIAAERHPTRSDLVAIQDKIAMVNGEMEQLVQRKLATTDPQDDKLAPFRQQAAVIRRNKDTSAARVHELAVTLKEHEATLADLQSQVKLLLGDIVLRGEELKKYVNSLRTKSTVYKRQRANLSTFKVEAGILNRTLQIISTVDPTVEMALVNHKKMKVDDVDVLEKDPDKSTDLSKKSLHDLSQLVAQTAQKLSQVRQEIQPLADKIKPVREEFQVVQQQYEQKKRVYEATSINITSQMEPLKNKVKELTDQLNVYLFKLLYFKEQRAISARQGAVEEQTRLWENTLQLLRCKMRAKNQPAARQERMHITQHSQMLTLS
ncbi:hypothetical protein K1T71_003849 [Dendrolimus kikuchii]|uniref:Uncharacterized protein n=1 Tax=Dendrolimus kikuchii TaxID=765133 RepID=A0ACC1D993_9NEOP|nr:hypothetical protein K1T71_003849 [Dendrolimus kikuchii]